ncbi:MAG TPA: hypothetical protein VGL61_19855 [Kofleriaceae bacterium]|jgi:hypothetical protein|nr:hypothetical protein [Gemmatimonadaceae bacterium]
MEPTPAASLYHLLSQKHDAIVEGIKRRNQTATHEVQLSVRAANGERVQVNALSRIEPDLMLFESLGKDRDDTGDVLVQPVAMVHATFTIVAVKSPATIGFRSEK